MVNTVPPSWYESTERMEWKLALTPPVLAPQEPRPRESPSTTSVFLVVQCFFSADASFLPVFLLVEACQEDTAVHCHSVRGSCDNRGVSYRVSYGNGKPTKLVLFCGVQAFARLSCAYCGEFSAVAASARTQTIDVLNSLISC